MNLSEQYNFLFFKSEEQQAQISALLTEIKQLREAEQKLRHGQLKLEQAQTLAHLGTVELNLTTNQGIWSDEMLRIYGLAPDERGQTFETWLNFVHPEDICDVAAIVAKAQETLERCSFSHRIICVTGEIRHINAEVQFRMDEHVVFLIGTAHDVTDLTITTAALQASEDAFRKSEFRFKQILEIAQEGIWLTNEKEATIFVNQRLCDILGYNANEMQGKELYHFIADADKNAAAKSVRFRLQGKREITEMRFVTKSENIILARMASSPMIDEQGDYKGTIATLFDITEHNKMEDARRFKTRLLNTIGQAVIGTEVNGIVNYWNKSAEKMYGWTVTEAIGQNIIDLTSSPGTEDVALGIREQIRKGETWSGEITCKRRNGQIFPVYATDSPIYKNQKIIGIIGVSTDISEKKKLEKLLDRANKLARNGSYEVDLMHNKLYWSDITREIHEVEKDFQPDMQTAINFYKEGYSRKAITQAIMTAMSEGIPWDMELEIITAKGNNRWVRAIGEADFESGKCVRLAGSFQDIHEQKMTQIRFRNLAEEKSQILETIGDAFFSLDHNWQITYFNKKAEGALSISKDEVLGRNLWKVFPLAVNTIFQHEYDIAIKENVDRSFEAFYEGSWYNVSTYPWQGGLSVYFKRNTAFA